MKPSERILEIYRSKMPKHEPLGIDTQHILVEESILQFFDEFYAEFDRVLTNIYNDVKNPKLK